MWKVFFGASLLSFSAAFASESPQVLKIRSQVGAINTNLAKLKKTEKTLDNFATEGADMTAYSEGDEIKKIVAQGMYETGTSNEEYYFNKGQLIFAFIVEGRGRYMEREKDKYTQRRYYFSGGDLIECREGKDGKNILSMEECGDKGDLVPQDAALYLKAAKIPDEMVERNRVASLFADYSLVDDVDELNQMHTFSYFSNEPSKEPETEAGLWESFFNTKSASIQSSSYTKVSPTQAIQSVVLKTGENITAVQTGMEYQNISLRFVCKGKLKGSTDLEKAATAMEWMNKNKVFPKDDDWLWGVIPKVLRKPGKRGEVGYLLDPDDELHPQIEVTRVGTLSHGTESFVEIGYVQGPM